MYLELEYDKNARGFIIKWLSGSLFLWTTRITPWRIPKGGIVDRPWTGSSMRLPAWLVAARTRCEVDGTILRWERVVRSVAPKNSGSRSMKVFFKAAQPCRRAGGSGRRLGVFRDVICAYFIRPTAAGWQFVRIKWAAMAIECGGLSLIRGCAKELGVHSAQEK
jgi:hypothetical protein